MTRNDNMHHSYPYPLVVDAVIDLHVGMPQDAKVDDLKPVLESLSQDFQRYDPIMTQTFNFGAQSGKQSLSSQSGVTGYILHCDDPNWSAQVTLNSFSFLHHKPYTNWEKYSDAAKQVWQVYKTLMKVTEINRAAIRYINRLNIPIGDELSDYLELIPHIPSTFENSAVISFLMQMHMPQADIESMLILNLVRLTDPSPNQMSYVLDFDLFREHKWRINEDNIVWELLESFRKRKNDLFEASITQKTRDMMYCAG